VLAPDPAELRHLGSSDAERFRSVNGRWTVIVEMWAWSWR